MEEAQEPQITPKAKISKATWIGLFIALIYPIIQIVIPIELLLGVRSLYVSFAIEWFIFIGFLALIKYWEKLPFSSIGLKGFSFKEVAIGIGGYFVSLLIISIVMVILTALKFPLKPLSAPQIAELPVALRLFIALSAGIIEEAYFRGYAIERIFAITKSKYAAALIPLFIFVPLHLPLWGVTNAIGVTVIGSVLTGIFLWRRNLLACMVMHTMQDSIAMLLLPYVDKMQHQANIFWIIQHFLK